MAFEGDLGNGVVAPIDFTSDISFGEVDSFTIILYAGITYTISLSENVFSNPAFDPVLTIENPFGVLLEDDDGGGDQNALLVYTPTVTGVHFIYAADFFNNDAGIYDLSVRVQADDFAPEDFLFAGIPVGARRLTDGVAVTGVIEQPSDSDTFVYAMTAGRTYAVRVEGVGAGGLEQIYVQIDSLTVNGLVVRSAENGVVAFDFTPTTTGDHGVTVEELGVDAAGAYRVAVTAAAPPVPTLAVADAAPVVEGDGTAASRLRFTVTLAGAASGPVSVAWRTADGTGRAGVDYVAASGTVSFAVGETSKVVEVASIPDALVEADRTVRLVLSAPTGGAVLGDAEAVGTIRNDDLPGLSIADALIAEGAAGERVMSFVVTLSAPAPGPVSVAFATGPATGAGLATAGSDYRAASGTVSFAAGETRKTVSVVVFGDAAPEPSERFLVTLSSPVGARLTDAVAVGTILADEGPTAGPDNVSGGDGDDALQGLAGDDVVLGLGGDDTLDGGDGNDTLSGGFGDDQAFGRTGDDRILLALGDDVADGGLGRDTASYETATAGVTVSLARLDVQNTGVGGRDRLANFENLTGGGFADRLTGDARANLIVGLAGADTLRGGGGADTLRGGPGADVYDLDRDAHLVTLVEAAGGGRDAILAYSRKFSLQGAAYAQIENLILRGPSATVGLGNAAANEITGNAGRNFLAGFGGADTLAGGAGFDRIFGGAGDDVIRDGDRGGRLYGDGGNDSVTGGASALLEGGLGADTLSGGDRARIWGDVRGNAAAGGADQITVGALGRATAGAGNDIVGGGRGSFLDGGFGEDILFVDETLGSAAAATTLSGGTGNDIFFLNIRSTGRVAVQDSGGTLDILLLQDFDSTNMLARRVGNDLIVQLFDPDGETTAPYAVAVLTRHFLGGTNRIEALAFTEVGAEDDDAQGFFLQGGLNGDGDDEIIAGTDAANVMNGRGGDDILFGAGGADVLNGEDADGNDGGDDILVGGPGRDTLRGGGGDDIFKFSPADLATGPDVIRDFELGDSLSGDTLDLVDLLRGFDGPNPITGGFLRATSQTVGGLQGLMLSIDMNGPGAPGGPVPFAFLVGVTERAEFLQQAALPEGGLLLF